MENISIHTPQNIFLSRFFFDNLGNDLNQSVTLFLSIVIIHKLPVIDIGLHCRHRYNLWFIQWFHPLCKKGLIQHTGKYVFLFPVAQLIPLFFQLSIDLIDIHGTFPVYKSLFPKHLPHLYELLQKLYRKTLFSRNDFIFFRINMAHSTIRHPQLPARIIYNIRNEIWKISYRRHLIPMSLRQKYLNPCQVIQQLHLSLQRFYFIEIGKPVIFNIFF